MLDDVKYVTKNTYEQLVKRFKPRKGDVLLTKGGTTGFAKHVDFEWDFAIWVHLACLRLNDRIHPEFLEAVLNSPNVYLQSQKYTRGIANKDLGLTRVVKIEFALPPLNLQEKYISINKAISKQKSKLKSSTIEYEYLFNSLMQNAFNGKLNLTKAA
ncbi:MAG: restriction endonuclease subunit S [Candidatus Thiodiazotropha endolucinida]|nr:restriction endonuclease subunit S [Candidatus Thiodiazotropha taylori]MCG8042684.1 restriction endonuclease subunit S [Candidatus Thiodiazotropha taylori]MCG8049229.1 restriction endonuclease subunit S [Candidatus Thiodiazotropha taylori]MCG8053121.1 restriction endonuclease subunit S [Candidatus Thiodiazotropha taylori]MCG8096841.1 restriction endonuclease subunit S [Candidatus Thiodiazotropha endolucinida]